MTRHAKLIDIAEIRLGYQSRESLKQQSAGELRIIQGKDIGDVFHIDTHNLTRIKKESNSERHLLQKGDVLFMAKGMNNNSLCLNYVPDLTVATASFNILRVSTPSVLPCYLAWWLNQAAAQSYFLQSMSKGATISFISMGALKETPVTIPSLEVQTKIVRIWELECKYALLLQRQNELWKEFTSKLLLKKVQEEDK
jgi:restriction endonuclease S subunit